MNIEKYLGEHVSKMRQGLPFKNWVVERSLEECLEEPIIHYVFQGRGVELRCDQDDKISAIFLLTDEHNDFGEHLFEIPFSLNRAAVLEHFGKPSNSGDKVSDPVLGEYGAWDRFSRPGHAIHVEYWNNADRIKGITLIRGDIVPE